MSSNTSEIAHTICVSLFVFSIIQVILKVHVRLEFKVRTKAKPESNNFQHS
jgi:hypothetical protein